MSRGRCHFPSGRRCWGGLENENLANWANHVVLLLTNGVDVMYERCDIDQTVPYPFGPTHPSNNKPYCRRHHLLKTFYSGPGGWTDRQLPDGTIVFTAPTGHTYTTEPLGGMVFPALAQPTGELGIPPTLDVPETARGVMMPKRNQTRVQDRRDRITQEWRQRTELIAEERQRQAWLAANYEPPLL